MVQLVCSLFLSIFFFPIFGAFAQDLTSSSFLRASGCCSSHGGVDLTRCQASGFVYCMDGWTQSSCRCEEDQPSNNDSSSVDTPTTVNNPSSVDTPSSSSRPSAEEEESSSSSDSSSSGVKITSGTLKGLLSFLETTSTEPMLWQVDATASLSFRFKIRNKRKLKVAMVQPVRLPLPIVLKRSRQAFSVEGSQNILSASLGDVCLDRYLADFTSVQKHSAFVMVTRTVECPLSQLVTFKWSGKVKR